MSEIRMIICVSPTVNPENAKIGDILFLPDRTPELVIKRKEDSLITICRNSDASKEAVGNYIDQRKRLLETLRFDTNGNMVWGAMCWPVFEGSKGYDELDRKLKEAEL